MTPIDTTHSLAEALEGEGGEAMATNLHGEEEGLTISPTVAAFVCDRAQRLQHLLEGLHATLNVDGRKDLLGLLELADADARAISVAVQLCQECIRNQKDQHIIQDLKTLVRMGGSPAVPVALRLAQRVVNR